MHSQQTASMSTVLIYGATGYSARLILENTDFASLPGPIILAGRDETKLQVLAKKWGLTYQAFTLDSASTIETQLQNVHTLLNCAGPFAQTAEPLMRAAVRTKTNYLDISAELESYLLAEELDQQAKASGVVLLPGCGVCMTVMVGLTAHVLKRVNTPSTVSTAIFMPGSITPGTARSAGGDQTLRRLTRSNGDLVSGDSGSAKSFDFRFDSGPVHTIMFGMPDVIALWHTFKVPNITSYAIVMSTCLAALANGLLDTSTWRLPAPRAAVLVEVMQTTLLTAPPARSARSRECEHLSKS